MLHLSPPKRPVCVVGRLGRKKRERARHDGIPRALSIFQLLLYLSGYPAGDSAEETDASFRIVKTSISDLISTQI